MRFSYVPLCVLAILCGCAHVLTHEADHSYLTLSLPRIALSEAEGERIQSVEVVITCARFSAINHIPNDWSVEAVGLGSEVFRFKASAEHGCSALWNTQEFDRFITIMDCEPSCFSIKAKVTASTVDKERTISFSRSELLLRPVSRPR